MPRSTSRICIAACSVCSHACRSCIYTQAFPSPHFRARSFCIPARAVCIAWYRFASPLKHLHLLACVPPGFALTLARLYLQANVFLFSLASSLLLHPSSHVLHPFVQVFIYAQAFASSILCAPLFASGLDRLNLQYRAFVDARLASLLRRRFASVGAWFSVSSLTTDRGSIALSALSTRSCSH